MFLNQKWDQVAGEKLMFLIKRLKEARGMMGEAGNHSVWCVGVIRNI